MAAFNKVNVFVADVANKVHNLGSDTLKWMLTNTAPTSASAVKADITEISAGNGYSAGGVSITTTSSTQTSGTYKLVLADAVLTATGAIGPFRYAVLYNSTPVAGPLIGYFDYGSALSLANTDTFTFDADATTGVLQIV